MRASLALRGGTAAEHERVDAAFSRFDLTNEGGYRAFLLAQAIAFLPTEAALDAAGAGSLIPDWPARRRGDLLKSDLAVFSITPPEPFHPQGLFPDKASMLGAIYVLEGSRLGGALLKRDVPESFSKRFLDARQDAGSWRKLQKSLDEFLTRPEQVEAATLAARQVFMRFEEGARRCLEA